MAEKYNANCSICGRPYYKCISCKDTMALNPWKAFCDTAEHYKVHQIISGFNSGVYTKDEAKTRLNNVDLHDLNSFRTNIKKIVKDILKEEKRVVKVVEDIKEPVKDVTESLGKIDVAIDAQEINYNVED